jgi:hypothetical protein
MKARISLDESENLLVGGAQAFDILSLEIGSFTINMSYAQARALMADLERELADRGAIEKSPLDELTAIGELLDEDDPLRGVPFIALSNAEIEMAELVGEGRAIG